MSNFMFDDHPVRTSGTPDRLRFVAKDVCAALGIENHREALARLPDDEKGVSQTDTLGGPQEMLTVTEPGLYRLIFRSDKPEAKRFQDWVFREVLPQIRRAARIEWLKQAFYEGKTGKVQLILLHELGIGAEQNERNELALKGFSPSQPFERGRYWAAVDQGYAANPRPGAFRLVQRPNRWLVYLLPDVVLDLARRATDEWRGISRGELRAQLALQPEWISGTHKQRMGDNSKTGGVTCWALAVTKDSPAGLLNLTKRLGSLEELFISKNSIHVEGEQANTAQSAPTELMNLTEPPQPGISP